MYIQPFPLAMNFLCLPNCIKAAEFSALIFAGTSWWSQLGTDFQYCSSSLSELYCWLEPQAPHLQALKSDTSAELCVQRFGSAKSWVDLLKIPDTFATGFSKRLHEEEHARFYSTFNCDLSDQRRYRCLALCGDSSPPCRTLTQRCRGYKWWNTVQF